MIPKIIHYCWLSGDAIPAKLQECMNSWKKHLPDYEFMLWDLSRFDINSTIWTKQAFKAKKYAFAADYIRLFAVYTYGGIYLDMDVEVVKSFDPLIDRHYILGFENSNGVEAGIFGGEKGSYWLKDCLDYYKERSFVLSDNKYDTLPLPIIMYQSMSKYIDSMEIFPNEYLTAKSYDTGIITITNNTYSIHHFAGSWLSEEARFSNEFSYTHFLFLPLKVRGSISKMYAAYKFRGVAGFFQQVRRSFKTLIFGENS